MPGPGDGGRRAKGLPVARGPVYLAAPVTATIGPHNRGCHFICRMVEWPIGKVCVYSLPQPSANLEESTIAA
jgi:hypothetical protein